MESFDWNTFYWGLLFLALVIGFILFARARNWDLHKKSGIRYKGKCPHCRHPEPKDARKRMKKEGGFRCEHCQTWVIPASRKPARNHKITTMCLGSGFAAVHTAEYEDMNWNRDIVQTGSGRYKSSLEAAKEALDWSRADGIPLSRSTKAVLMSEGVRVSGRPSAPTKQKG